MAERKGVQIKKRKRVNPTYRWAERITLEFINKVLERVKDSPDSFERPTSQRFYEGLAKSCPRLQEIPWSCMKSKLRHCKLLYIEASKWKQQTGATLMADGDEKSVIDYVQRKCPHYDELHQLFGQRIKIEDYLDNDFDQSLLTAPWPAFSSGELSEVSFDTDHSSYEDTNQILEELPVASDIFAGIDNNVQEYKTQPKSAKTSNNSALTIRMSLEQDKLQLKRDKFEWKKKRQQQELDNYLKIKKMELELKERLKILELELKYRKTKEDN